VIKLFSFELRNLIFSKTSICIEIWIFLSRYEWIQHHWTCKCVLTAQKSKSKIKLKLF